MASLGTRAFQPRTLIVDDDLGKLDTSLGRAAEGLARVLEERDVEVVRALSFDDGRAVVAADASIQAVVLNWDLGADDEGSHRQAIELLAKLRERHGEVPVFLVAERTTAKSMKRVQDTDSRVVYEAAAEDPGSLDTFSLDKRTGAFARVWSGWSLTTPELNAGAERGYCVSDEGS